MELVSTKHEFFSRLGPGLLLRKKGCRQKITFCQRSRDRTQCHSASALLMPAKSETVEGKGGGGGAGTGEA